MSYGDSPEWQAFFRRRQGIADASQALQQRGVPVRVANALARRYWPNMAAVDEATDVDLRGVRNVGAKGLAAIRAVIPPPAWLTSTEPLPLNC